MGWIQLEHNGQRIQSLCFVDQPVISPEALPEEWKDQLDGYFLRRVPLELPIELSGTPFQKEVWKKVSTIPLGKTVSYHWLASECGGANYARAVANANAKNPILLLVPCHRVIGVDGSLTGYAGGLSRKKQLLSHESGQAQLFT
ncbi:MAG: methylated-DNA--[protein]-cysteine S-methyltransferase [Bacteroidota bacterium]